MINTDKLIPGEYYWVKIEKEIPWKIASWVEFPDHEVHYFNASGLRIESVYQIDCDTEGNPIPIKRENTFSENDMIAAAKYGYEFRDSTSFPEHKFEDSCINNFKQYLKSNQ